MNKIIVAFDPLRYNEATATYAVDVARENAAHLFGIFLGDFTCHSYNLYQMVGRADLHFPEKTTLNKKMPWSWRKG